MAEQLDMLPTAQDVFAAILRAAARQIATTAEGKRIVAAGLGVELQSLLEQVAGNAANPIYNAFEDATIALKVAPLPSPSPSP